MAVTTANTLGLSNVCAEIYGSSSTAGRSLMQCHADATGTFNPTYAKTGDTLLDFRGYEHTAPIPAPVAPNDFDAYLIVQTGDVQTYWSAGQNIDYIILQYKLTSSSNWIDETNPYYPNNFSGDIDWYYVKEGLAAGTYDFRLKCYGLNGSIVYSYIEQVTIPPEEILPKLATPDVHITGNGVNSISISYNAISGASRYKVQISTSPSFSPIAGTYYPTATAFTFSNLSEDTYYYIRVQAQNTGTTAPDSDYGYVEGGTGILPTPPYDPEVSGNYIVDTNWVYLKTTWKPGTNMTSYTARYRFLGESTWNTYSGISGTDTSFEYNRYEKNATYEMQLVAVNQYGEAYGEILVVHTAG